MRPTFWKTIRVMLFIVLIVFVGIQFVRPPLDNPPVTGDLEAPPEVKRVLERACYDCHSNQTRLAWFDQPAPAYWLVTKDVREARAVLNFSNWGSLTKGQQAASLFESIMQIEQQAMPLSQYTFLHHGGIITAEELDVLKKYALTLAYNPKFDSTRDRAAAQQYGTWINAGGAAPDRALAAHVKDEYNGIGYQSLAGWIDWQPVSTTERYDNGTLRMIVANDLAVRAIREGQTHPYPDGAIFAKAAYAQDPDSTGEIRAGAFIQVEFMIRDSKKYAGTFGWGWARWVKGLAMKPFGQDASFVTSCMNCHRPLASTDHTFTFPLSDTVRLRDPLDGTPDGPGGWPLRSRFITSFVDTNTHTMSTLYGNEMAVNCARSGIPYKPGSTLTLVNWTQREDPHWFGGRIPQRIASEEMVLYTGGGEVNYRYYAGPGMTRKVVPAASSTDRVQYITAKKASVVPIGAIDGQ
ncbi:MAG TPA: cytochrome P460 family protein [Puia sp.]|nr:cytochrome P460 family protein [Puia sp.]